MKSSLSSPNTPTIMITGTHGFVGTRAMERYKSAIAVPSELLRNAGAPLAEFVWEQQPDIIVNAAAISDIGTCERNPEESYAANVVLPVVLAKAAREAGAKLISFSSDQVYTGCPDDGPYCESDSLPEPANLYARHKLEAEQRVLDIHPDAVMLRATWMYDMPVYGHANRGNFLVNVLDTAMRRERMRFSSREYRGITYVRRVVSLLDQVFELPGGVYNYGSENDLNMFETALALLKSLGLEEHANTLLEDAAWQGHVQIQPRHNLWMNCGKLREHGIYFDTTEGGFRSCVKDYGICFLSQSPIQSNQKQL